VDDRLGREFDLEAAIGANLDDPLDERRGIP